MSPDNFNISIDDIPDPEPEPEEKAPAPQPEPEEPTEEEDEEEEEQPKAKAKARAEPEEEEPKEEDEEPEEKETKEEPKKSEPMRYKFKVNGEEVKLTKAEIQERINRGHLAERAEAKFHAANELSKKAQQSEATIKKLINDFKVKGPSVLVEFFAADMGDEDRATIDVLKAYERWATPIYELEDMRKHDPQRYQLVAEQKRLERERLKLQKEYERINGEKETQAQEAARIQEQQAEITFQNQVADLIDGKVPNDDLSLMIYERARNIAKSQGLDWTPELAASTILQERPKFSVAKQAAPSAEATNGRAPEENIRLAKEKRARDAKAGIKQEQDLTGSSVLQKRSRRDVPFITIDDLRETIR